MENIIIIICDSLSYEDNILDDMPNLKKKEGNIINFNNFFSQGPYTECAIIPLFSGSNITDYNGNFYSLKKRPININEIFKSLDYKTYNTLWMYPNTYSFLRGLDEYDYMQGPITLSIVAYRINYFKEIYLKKKFTEIDMRMIILLMDDFFLMSERFIDDYMNYKFRFDLLKKHTDFKDFDFDKFRKIEIRNRKEYFYDKKKYIINLLKDGNSFFSDKSLVINRSDEFKDYLPELNIKLLVVMIKQFYYAMKNRKQNQSISTLKYTLENYGEDNILLNSIRRWVRYTISYPGNYNYNYLSGKVILNRTFDYLYNNKSKRNFIISHIMDTHTPFNFFSSECNDLQEEFSAFNEYYKSLYKKKNNFYKFSKKYIDNQIGDLIEKLEKNNMMENTTIIITSDHGSSYLGEINRKKITSTFYDENYKIPLMILNENIKGKEIDNLGISTQFIPTILDFLGVPDKNNWIKENSIFQNDRDYIIFEYFGPGCPDYTRKPRLFCIRSEKYKIQYKFYPVNQKKPSEIIAIHDLENDPKELTDIKDTVEYNDEIKKLIKALELRTQSIK